MISIMTFNLRTDVSSDGGNAWPHRKEAAARVITESGADIVGTQEGKPEMVIDLERLLPDYLWVGEGRQGGSTDEHCAIFYRRDRFEAVDSGNFGLSERPALLGHMSWDTACPRMCTWVRLRRTDGGGAGDLLVFNTHLDHISEEARTKGMSLIIERMRIAERSAVAAVLTGDFNCTPDSETVGLLQRAGLRSAYEASKGGTAVGRTFHGFEGEENGEPIDYIYIMGDASVESVRVDRALYDGRYPSDHYPVTAIIQA